MTARSVAGSARSRPEAVALIEAKLEAGQLTAAQAAEMLIEVIVQHVLPKEAPPSVKRELTSLLTELTETCPALASQIAELVPRHMLS